MSQFKNFSLINKGQTIEGSISSQGRLDIHGTVKGKIEGETVVIAPEGVVHADVKVAGITIGGTFEGEIRASNELIILSSGSCTGKVVCRNLVVEAGGVLNAEVACLSGQDEESEKKLLTAP
jgi:cytoskeletal protein CcmA (bactofilin family)